MRPRLAFARPRIYGPAMSSLVSADLDPAQLASIMRWYLDMGVDCFVGDEPRDRFADWAAEARGTPPARAQTPPTREDGIAPRAPLAAPPVAPTPATLATDAAARTAAELATHARDLDALRAAMDSFEGCALKRTASRLVFEDGARGARVMLVGEAPGADEDKQGRPFVGRAGQLLDRMLAAIGLDRSHVYIANVVPWRPPGNRAPTPQETAICLPFIHRQIALCDPDILVCLGGSSVQTLLGVREGITRARGSWRDFHIEGVDGTRKSIRALATLHPAYLLRTPIAKRGAWADMRALKKAMDEAPSGA
jgi:uracil-DNA glycosylase